MENSVIERKKILFIINPIAGIRNRTDLEQTIRQRVDPGKYDYSIVTTTRAGEAVELSKRAVEAGTQIIVAAGGDGTVNETSRALIGTDAALGIIPLGSGNGLARHLGIPLNAKKAIDLVLEGKILRIDTASLDDKVFLSMAGVGYDAHVAKKFAKAGHRGFVTYFRIASHEYRLYKPRKFNMIIDGKPVKRKAFMVNFANSNQFGNNVSISPNASLEDGFIDVCIVRKVPFMRVPFVLPLLFTKRFDRTVYIEIIRAKDVTLKRKKGKAIHLDGDPYDYGKEFKICIHPASLSIVVP